MDRTAACSSLPIKRLLEEDQHRLQEAMRALGLR